MNKKQVARAKRLAEIRRLMGGYPSVIKRLEMLESVKGQTGMAKDVPELRYFSYDMYLQGYALGEIAEVLHVTAPTIRHWNHKEALERLSRAKVRLEREASLPIQVKLPEKERPKPAELDMPAPTLVGPGTITMISSPKRSLWQRIRGLFA